MHTLYLRAGLAKGLGHGDLGLADLIAARELEDRGVAQGVHAIIRAELSTRAVRMATLMPRRSFVRRSMPFSERETIGTRQRVDESSVGGASKTATRWEGSSS